MENKDLNIRSSTIEKTLELAKEFLSKLIGPSIEEFGLLIASNLKYIRFKNEVSILLKAKAYVEKRNLTTKLIPVKILVPLLENSSLEEDEELQDKWAKMLTNMVDSQSNLQNHVFPYLLSQISIQEFKQLKNLSSSEQEWSKAKEQLQTKLEAEKSRLSAETANQKKDIELAEQQGFWLNLEAYEQANLLRLGLVRETPPKIKIFEEAYWGLRITNKTNITAKYDHDKFGFRITELGKKLLEICEFRET